MHDADMMIARHQRVREFIETRFPGRHVTEIREDARTSYRQALHSLAWVLSDAEISYTVEAIGIGTSLPGIQCRVAPLEDGTLRCWDVYYLLPQTRTQTRAHSRKTTA